MCADSWNLEKLKYYKAFEQNLMRPCLSWIYKGYNNAWLKEGTQHVLIDAINEEICDWKYVIEIVSDWNGLKTQVFKAPDEW